MYNIWNSARARVVTIHVAMVFLLGLAGGPAELAAFEPPSLEIIAQPRAGANERDLAQGDTLVTGDGVRIRVGTEQRAYIYVVAVGASGSAVLLQPFSGRPADALMAARTRRSIPSGTAVLPLDRHVGNETIVAIASRAPVPDPQGMVLEIESQLARGSALTPASLAEFGAVRTFTFQHNAAPSAGAVRRKTEPALFGADGGESGVMSGSGSRIDALLSGKPLPKAGVKPAAAVPLLPRAVAPDTDTSTPDTNSQDPNTSSRAVQPADETGLLTRIRSLFGSDDEELTQVAGSTDSSSLMRTVASTVTQETQTGTPTTAQSAAAGVVKPLPKRIAASGGTTANTSSVAASTASKAGVSVAAASPTSGLASNIAAPAPSNAARPTPTTSTSMAKLDAPQPQRRSVLQGPTAIASARLESNPAENKQTSVDQQGWLNRLFGEHESRDSPNAQDVQRASQPPAPNKAAARAGGATAEPSPAVPAPRTDAVPAPARGQAQGQREWLTRLFGEDDKGRSSAEATGTTVTKQAGVNSRIRSTTTPSSAASISQNPQPTAKVLPTRAFAAAKTASDNATSDTLPLIGSASTPLRPPPPSSVAGQGRATSSSLRGNTAPTTVLGSSGSRISALLKARQTNADGSMVGVATVGASAAAEPAPQPRSVSPVNSPAISRAIPQTTSQDIPPVQAKAISAQTARRVTGVQQTPQPRALSPRAVVTQAAVGTEQPPESRTKSKNAASAAVAPADAAAPAVPVKKAEQASPPAMTQASTFSRLVALFAPQADGADVALDDEQKDNSYESDGYLPDEVLAEPADAEGLPVAPIAGVRSTDGPDLFGRMRHWVDTVTTSEQAPVAAQQEVIETQTVAQGRADSLQPPPSDTQLAVVESKSVAVPVAQPAAAAARAEPVATKRELASSVLAPAASAKAQNPGSRWLGQIRGLFTDSESPNSDVDNANADSAGASEKPSPAALKPLDVKETANSAPVVARAPSARPPAIPPALTPLRSEPVTLPQISRGVVRVPERKLAAAAERPAEESGVLAATGNRIAALLGFGDETPAKSNTGSSSVAPAVAAVAATSATGANAVATSTSVAANTASATVAGTTAGVNSAASGAAARPTSAMSTAASPTISKPFPSQTSAVPQTTSPNMQAVAVARGPRVVSPRRATTNESVVAAIAEQPVVTAPAKPNLAPLALTSSQALAEIDTTADDGAPAALVLVVTPRNIGSALVVDDVGHLLTAWHVVAGFSQVSVWFKAPGDALPDTTRPFTARVVRANRQSDLALLVLEGDAPDLAPLKLANVAELTRGEIVHVLGHAGGERWAHSMARFVRLKSRHSWVTQGRFVHRAPVLSNQAVGAPEASGGALFNGRMQLVGLNVQVGRNSGQVYSIGVETIRRFLRGELAPDPPAS